MNTKPLYFCVRLDHQDRLLLRLMAKNENKTQGEFIRSLIREKAGITGVSDLNITKMMEKNKYG